MCEWVLIKSSRDSNAEKYRPSRDQDSTRRQKRGRILFIKKLFLSVLRDTIMTAYWDLSPASMCIHRYRADCTEAKYYRPLSSFLSVVTIHGTWYEWRFSTVT